MNRASALTASVLFFFVAPGSIAGLVPWLFTQWRISASYPIVASAIGALLVVVAGAGLIECFLRFALTAQGTPSPIAPTKRLVVTGLYRHVRNPMYVAVTGLILGQALLFGSIALLAYGFIVAIGFHLFVLNFEEPRLERDFGDAYVRYCAAVPRWTPRLAPWSPDAA